MLEAPTEEWRPKADDAYYSWVSLLYHLEHHGASTAQAWPVEASLEQVVRAFLRLTPADADAQAWQDRAGPLLASYAPWIRGGHPEELDVALRVGREELAPDTAGAALVLLESAMEARLAGDAAVARRLWLAAERSVEALRARDGMADAAAKPGFVLALEEVGQQIDGGTPEQAVPALARARAYVEERGSPGDTFVFTVEALNLWVALDRTAELEADLDRFHRAAEGWEKPPAAWKLGRLEVRLGIRRAEAARTGEGDAAPAREALEAALRRPELDPEDRAMALFWLADLELDADRVERGRELTEELRALLAGDDAQALERSWNELAVLDAELARAGSADAGRVLESVLARFERQRARWAELEAQSRGRGLAYLRDQFALLGAAVDLALQARGPEAALDLVGRFQEVGTLARSLDAPAWRPGAWRELLPAEGGLLVLVPGARRSWALLVDGAGVEVHAIADVYAIDRVRRDVDRAWGRLDADSRTLPAGRYPSADDALRAALDGLARALTWDALAPRVSAWRHLRVVGADGLGTPPLDLLPAADGATPVGARVAVSYLPSLVVGLELARRTGSAPDAGGFVALDALSGLAAPAADADAVARALAPLAGRASQTDGSTQATRAWGGAGAGAFLGHGVDSGDPDRPVALLLDDDPRTVWTASDLDAQPAPGFVELIACGTWRGPLRRGDDGRQYLYGSLLLGGAHTVLTSQRPLVADVALDELEALHAELRTGASPAEALRRVRAASPAERGLHPYLMQVVGWDRFPSATVDAASRATGGRAARVGTLAVWAAGVAALAGLALWFRRARRAG